MTKVTIWHNPRCTKSRQTLALLQEKGCDITERRYLDNAPSEAEIRDALGLLDLRPIALMRTKETEFKEQGLTKDSDDATLIAAMAATPKLIERPVVFANGRAALGRPPEAVLEIL
ncbi:arsenate reductase (glutaredoxin) [Psychromarinibacter sp. C21-152]|uniref:Arsenate reductase n=1 Tax=Psychromarinibacter sediminicola TaxID=3033385 RepID=A0AAE3NTM5_9RHOB|nr:arsenate reductase (glutaredoxin) [Psychromarinibacter sediminicola]MDF0600347.1 arsenate reductase (glutaredoxin) [Psychromarinibacter sediminicola]